MTAISGAGILYNLSKPTIPMTASECDATGGKGYAAGKDVTSIKAILKEQEDGDKGGPLSVTRDQTLDILI